MQGMPPRQAAHFYESIAPGIENLRQQHAQDQAGYQVNQRNDLVSGFLNARMSEGLERGLSPDQIYGNIRKDMQTTNVVSNMPFPDQEKLLLGALQHKVEGLAASPDWEKESQLIRGILTGDRKDANGNSLGPMTNAASLGGLPNQLLAQTEATAERRLGSENFNLIANLKQLAARGDPGYIQARDAFAKQHPILATDRIMSMSDYMYDNALMGSAAQARRAQYRAALDNDMNVNIHNNVMPALQAGTAKIGGIKPFETFDMSGEPKTINSDEQIKAALPKFESWLDQKYPNALNDPQQAQAKLLEQAPIYGQGIENKQWKETMGAGYMSADNSLAAGQPPSQATSKGYEMYKQLMAISPNMARNHLDEKTDRFYWLAQSAEDAGMTQNQALTMAAKSMQDPNSLKDEPRLREADAQEKIHTALKTSWWPHVTDDLSTVANSDQVATEVRDAANLLHNYSQMPLDSAIKAAAEKVSANYSIINGAAVRTAGKQVPDNFGDLANHYIDNWWEANKARLEMLGETKDDVTISEIGRTGNWALVSKRGWMHPFDVPNASFNIADLANANNVWQHNSLEGKINDRGKDRQVFDSIINTPFGNPAP
ncbi:hypothetical protein [Methylovirgula sp. 4M-Z18]|uniref:hypothetical protein n=1 Tax=Methylovirgula sp. 4M-Z18 TaxID=2293567 RepID=UPI000E2FB05B|nr:hypothetical protein [Methylovirgula sp. 4M-Z18]RFB78309.1 hypothetical protein DYH55_16295 [Methylovirgula sp. 4M-Z18]